MERGDIIVIDGMGTDCSLMGENVAHVCMYAGAGGAVLNGVVIMLILEIWICRFFYGADEVDNQVFKFTDYNVPVNCAGAQVFQAIIYLET